MKVKVDITKHIDGDGITLDVEDGYKIITETDGESATIIANREGLITLAKLMLHMAQPSVKQGNHFDLDTWNVLDEGSVELTVMRRD